MDSPAAPSAHGVFRAALRRFALLLGAAAGLVVLGGLVVGLAVGAALDRAISLAFYGVGAFLVLAGFFVGNRGPVRTKDDRPGLLFLGSHRRRWATAEEREGSLNDSAIFVTLGIALIVLGVVADSRYDLV